MMEILCERVINILEKGLKQEAFKSLTPKDRDINELQSSVQWCALQYSVCLRVIIWCTVW